MVTTGKASEIYYVIKFTCNKISFHFIYSFLNFINTKIFVQFGLFGLSQRSPELQEFLHNLDYLNYHKELHIEYCSSSRSVPGCRVDGDAQKLTDVGLEE